MVFALWLSQGSWSNGWTSRTDTWSARCLLQCKSRQINQMTSEHRFNSKKLFFVKPVKGTFVVAISGREVKLVVSHKVTVTDLWNAFLTPVSSLLITYHAGVLYWPLLMCHSKNSNIQLRLSLNFHLSYYANDTNLYIVAWIFHWLFFLSFQLASFSYIILPSHRNPTVPVDLLGIPQKVLVTVWRILCHTWFQWEQCQSAW